MPSILFFEQKIKGRNDYPVTVKWMIKLYALAGQTRTFCTYTLLKAGEIEIKMIARRVLLHQHFVQWHKRISHDLIYKNGIYREETTKM